jgi:hypothetical protein
LGAHNSLCGWRSSVYSSHARKERPDTFTEEGTNVIFTTISVETALGTHISQLSFGFVVMFLVSFALHVQVTFVRKHDFSTMALWIPDLASTYVCLTIQENSRVSRVSRANALKVQGRYPTAEGCDSACPFVFQGEDSGHFPATLSDSDKDSCSMTFKLQSLLFFILLTGLGHLNYKTIFSKTEALQG